jgi:hypothetical protein
VLVFAPWQSRHAGLISVSAARVAAANHGIVTGVGSVAD